MLLDLLLAPLLAQADAPPRPGPAASCPPDMVLVEGTHAENVQRVCTSYRGGHCFDFFPGLFAAEPRFTPVRTCMDRHEWPNRAGALPVVMLRFIEAERECAAVGKRLCTEFEWELACEGPSALPFPYGYAHDPAACNVSKPYRGISERRLASNDPAVRAAETQRLWQGEPSGSYPACVSPYGVVDLVGNVEEWVSTSRPEWPHRSSLKGGYWSKPWAGCRGTNDSHGPMFRFYEIGFRCCKDPRSGP
ncbi:SUMF1/EgtB/PvdO family nonheme iron enzyme [Sorangium sp. So ce281]|uniref:formylglycine-generating enzyme family protein n=1 Tax=unclassified Sorangium TaxID=2621164 RepID=UPI003F60CB8A